MDLSCIIPVAPRDIAFLPDCLSKVLYSIGDAIHRQPSPLGICTVRIVIDGVPPDDKLKELVEKMPLLIERAYHKPTDETPRCKIELDVLPSAYGAGIARNYALAKTDPTSLVCFMDADDEMFPWSIYTRMDAWISVEQDHPRRIPFIYTPTLHQMADPVQAGVIHRVVREIAHPANIATWIAKQNVFLTTAIMTTAEALQRAGGFEPKMICGEDGCLWRRVLTQNPSILPVPVNLITQIYNIRKDSQCRTLQKPNEEAFHLDPGTHGNMGQSLDTQAVFRGMSLSDASTPAEKIAILCGQAVVPTVTHEWTP